jgi:hypothetical protein
MISRRIWILSSRETQSGCFSYGGRRTTRTRTPFALTILAGEGKSSESHLIVDGQQRILSLLLLLNGWHVKVGDMEYTRQPISFNPTYYVLEVGRRGLDLSGG